MTETGIDAVKLYLDDAIDRTETQIIVLEREPAHHTSHAHTALDTLRKVRKEIEWIGVEGYTSHRICEKYPDNACDECLHKWALIDGEVRA